MDLQGVVRYVQRTCGNSSIHFLFASSSLFLSPLTVTLLTVSAYPFPCGYAGVQYLFAVPKSQQYLLKALLSNWRPLFEMRVRDSKPSGNIFPNKSLGIHVPDIHQWFSFNSLGEVIRADQQISLIPCCLRERTYNVQPHWAKGQGLDRRLRTPPDWWMFGTNLWRWSHFFTYSCASLCIFGHQ